MEEDDILKKKLWKIYWKEKDKPIIKNNKFLF